MAIVAIVAFVAAHIFVCIVHFGLVVTRLAGVACVITAVVVALGAITICALMVERESMLESRILPV